MRERKAAHEAHRQAYNDRTRRCTERLPGSPRPEGVGNHRYQGPDESERCLSGTRTLGGHASERNIVGAHQQERLLGGEKYGFYTVVNDAYFDSGPTVRGHMLFMYGGMCVACNGEDSTRTKSSANRSTGYMLVREMTFVKSIKLALIESCSSQVAVLRCQIKPNLSFRFSSQKTIPNPTKQHSTFVMSVGRDVEWCELGRDPEVLYGQRLVKALQTAEHGTTIEMADACCPPEDGFVVEKSIRLIGTRNFHIRTWNIPTLLVRSMIRTENCSVAVAEASVSRWGSLCPCLHAQTESAQSMKQISPTCISPFIM